MNNDRTNFNTVQEYEIFGDRDFPYWLTQQQISLACTTYQTSRLMLIGVVPETSGMMVIDLTNGAIVTGCGLKELSRNSMMCR